MTTVPPGSPDEPNAPPPPPPPGAGLDPDSAEAFAAELEALGYIPPDPDEPKPLDLWAEVGETLPWGTMFLLLSWAVMFVLLGAHRALDDTEALVAWGANATYLPPRDMIWRLLSSTFLHAGMAHVFFNATSLFVLGQAVERIFARWGFWVVYVLGGACASYASLAYRAWRHTGVSVSVGGSGAIFALGGALLVVVIRLRHKLAPTRARALAAALLYLIMPGFAAGYATPGTDNVAHAAGLLSGALLGAILPTDARLGGRGYGFVLRALSLACALALAASLVLAVRSGLRSG